MKTIKITKKDLDENNFYKEDGIGEWNEYENVNIEIDEKLGWVKFKMGVYVNGFIEAKAGSGIEAGEGIEAGSGIKAGWGIEAGFGIKAGSGIEAGEGIKAGSGIKAGEGIKAGWGIEAGEGIKAGSGILAGLYITCKLLLSFKYNLFAGVAWYKKAEGNDKKITCGKLAGGTVCYGEVEELGMPDKEAHETDEIINLNGKKYKRIN